MPKCTAYKKLSANNYSLIISTFGGENKIDKDVYDLRNRLGIQVFSIQPKYRFRNGKIINK